ncbi:2-keto-4-carboxy-3-hexenedioate hydratase [Usitatibacter rugosus]|uniref:2-keto-4-carboxy-3-hexenedioate hydratase n=1 Tax=Usitatibacter rugosus TaxID=2732067 RepID=A0A6M4GU55_9PROT|nr:amidohydrolase family protein [Usitatibacter rugosus]QJR10869.1 2-keto-4-carboxy-3-hexenedioate hydratase [Usitatibacter rugosus]
MIIDCHGHYTTFPKSLQDFRDAQMAAALDRSLPEPKDPVISDEELRETVGNSQLKRMRERGIDFTLFSPRAAGMGHHAGNEATSLRWARISNDLIHRISKIFPESFAGVCQLPQSPGVAPARSIPELERCVGELGFVGCNLNPDASGGYWKDQPLTDRAWYPLYEKLVELEVPAMVHVSASCNPNFHTSGAHYLNGDTTAFMQFLLSDLFRDFPTLRFILPHGGGAVPFHWGRFRGLGLDNGRVLEERLLGNVFFDTCVYDPAGIDYLTRTVPVDNILFASETFGAVTATDPRTGYAFDDTKRHIEAAAHLDDVARAKIYSGNALRVYPRLGRLLAAR